MFYFSNRSLGRNAFVAWILPLVCLWTIAGTQAFATTDKVVFASPSYPTFSTTEIPSNLPAANAIFGNTHEGFINWTRVLTNPPTLEPSILVLVGIALVGIAAWGRSHPPKIKHELYRADERQIIEAQINVDTTSR